MMMVIGSETKFLALEFFVRFATVIGGRWIDTNVNANVDIFRDRIYTRKTYFRTKNLNLFRDLN